MQQIIFWKDWYTPYKIFYNVFLCLFAASLLTLLIQYSIGIDAIISWDIVNELKSVSIVLDKFTVNFYDFTVDTHAYLIFQKFVGSNFEVNYLAYLFFTFVSISIILLLSAVTCLKAVWYYGGIGIFVIFLVSIRFDLVVDLDPIIDTGYLQLVNILLITAIILFCSTSYYFYAYKKDTSFELRFLIFSIITILLGGLVWFKSDVSHPVLLLANYGCLMPVILTIIFIFIVSLENIDSILYLVTRSKSSRSGSNLLHFTFFSLIYLSCLVLLFLEYTRVVEFDLIYLNAFVVFVISAILGIWGFKKRNVIFKGQLPFAPIGAYIYLGFAIISTITIGYYFATGNDPMVEVFEEIIILAHLIRGGLFFLYILNNFFTPIAQNMQVHKIVYQPNRTPFFIVTGLSILGITAMVFKSNFALYDRVIAGYHNGLGDLYVAENNYSLANKYYNDTYVQGEQSHKSIYAIASLAKARGDDRTAIRYYNRALSVKPTPFSYANLSDAYLSREKIFDALFILEEGIKKFPLSGELYNNLALVYNNMNMTDSTLFYLDLASAHLKNKKVPASNLLGFFAKNSNHYVRAGHTQTPQLQAIADSLQNNLELSSYLPFISNRLVLFETTSLPESENRGIGETESRKTKRFTDSPFHPFTDSVRNSGREGLGGAAFCWLYNYSIYHLTQEGKGMAKSPLWGDLGELLEYYRGIEQNHKYDEDLLFLTACYNYYYNDMGKGKILLDQLQENSMYMSYQYNNILGLWMLQQGAYKLAAKYFNTAISLIPDAMKEQKQNAKVNYAFTLSAMGDKSPAIEAWKELENDTNTLTSMQPHNRAPIQVNMIAKYFIKVLKEHDHVETRHASSLHGHALPSYSERHACDTFVDWAGAWESDSKSGSHSAGKPGHSEPHLEWDSEHTLKTDSCYKLLLKRASFYEDGRISAANFYNKINKDHAYDILLEGLNLNPYSVKLYKAYILYCLELNLTSYAQHALDELQILTTEEDFTGFLQKYYEKQTLIEKSLEEWD
ncbi:MAG: hypothetical protein IIA88_01430 [Bacteroidetes bacterium]|nr:hypothetical protein [Bacteroidota bacterium]